MTRKCVWVLEIGILNTHGTKITSWEIWQSFNTRKEAVEFRDKSSLQKSCWRIVKYVPEDGRTA